MRRKEERKERQKEGEKEGIRGLWKYLPTLSFGNALAGVMCNSQESFTLPPKWHPLYDGRFLGIRTA